MATLQTSLQFESLRDVALDAWGTFTRTVEISDLGPVLNQIVVVLLKYFTEYTQNQKQQALKIFTYLIVEHGSLFKAEYLDTLCDFPASPQFQEINRVLQTHRRSTELMTRIKHVLNSVAHENATVVETALRELRDILDSNQMKFHEIILEESDNDTINVMIKVILETLRKYSGSRPDLQLACCECLGMLGALDPARVNVSINRNVDILSDPFDSFKSTSTFACRLIERQLVPAFRSAHSTKTQDNLAFAIQELLRLCEFTPESWDSQNRKDEEKSKHLKRLWDSFPKAVVKTIRPLLTAKYTIASSNMEVLPHPIYPTKSSFKDWLQSWVVDMITKVKGSNAKKLFSALKNVVIQDNMEVTLYLLPYLLLQVLTHGEADEQEQVLSEFMAVLSSLVESDESEGVEKRQLSSQVCGGTKSFLRRIKLISN
jgi:serine/threonine-protein kinase ATR